MRHFGACGRGYVAGGLASLLSWCPAVLAAGEVWVACEVAA